jgi:hypothetical protein
MATLDDNIAATPPDDGPIVSPGASLQRRRHAQDVLAAQRQQIDHLENELHDELQRLAEQMAQDLAKSQFEEFVRQHGGGDTASSVEADVQLEHLRQQLAARQGEMERVLAQFEHARVEAARLDQELHASQSVLQATQAQTDQRRAEFAALQEQLADAEAQLAASRQRQEQLRRDLADAQERLAVQETAAKAESRRLARELKEQRDRRLAETKKRETDIQAVTATGDAQLASQLTAARLEVAQARSRLTDLSRTLEQRSEELAEERRKGESLKDQAAKLRDAVKKVQSDRSDQKADLARAAELKAEHQEELKKLQSQCESLGSKLAEAEARLSESAKSDSAKNDGAARKNEDLQRRFEMAVEEVRELKKTNAELEARANRRSDAPPAKPGAGIGLDWETQKQRLLASLEADDRDDREADAERQTIEGTIRITDQIVAQKDREIAELKKQLAEAASAGSAVNEADLAEVFNQDELIRQERERLKQSQAEWREKIGKAEISISVERAKIARERAELEEKLRILQREQQSRLPNESPSEGGKPPRSRWLARLGLKEVEEKDDAGG